MSVHSNQFENMIDKVKQVCIFMWAFPKGNPTYSHRQRCGCRDGNLVPRPSLLFLPCRRGERPWLRLVKCLCIQIKAAPGVGPQLNFSTGQFNSVWGRGNSSCFQASCFALGFRSHRVYTFLAPSSAFEARL